MNHTYLAVDAGGSRTRATLVGADGRVCGRGAAGPGNWAVQGRDAWAAAIRAAVAEACASTGGVPRGTHVWVGTAGVPAGQQDEAVVALVAELVPGARVRVSNDAELLHRPAPRTCVVAIAGTGSVVLAIDTRGRVRQWGGLGWLLGDEGSAFHVGRAAVRAVLGGEPAAHALRARLAQAHLRGDDWIRYIYGAEDPRAVLASLAPCVTAAAEAGDPAAAALLREATAPLAALIAGAATHEADLRLGGALMQVPCYRQALLSHLGGVSFASVECVSVPSEYAAQTLRMMHTIHYSIGDS